MEHRDRKWTAPWRWIVRFLFGPDVFIAYARLDGREYANSLAQALSGSGFGLSCSLDLRHSIAGQKIPLALWLSLRRSSMMVVVATRGAAASKLVSGEVAEFQRTNRPIAFVVLDDWEVGAHWPELDEANMVRSDAGNEPAQSPSDETLRQILERATFTKQSLRLRYASFGAAILIATAAVGVVLAVNRTRQEVRRAAEARLQAEDSIQRFRAGVTASRAVEAMKHSPQAGALLSAESLLRATGTRSGWVATAMQVVEDALLRVQGRALPGHKSVVTAVAFGQGDEFATGDESGRVLLWNADTVERGPRILEAPRRRERGERPDDYIPEDVAPDIVALDFSLDGRWLAAVARNGSTTLWEAHGTAAYPLARSKERLEKGLFSPDSRRFVTLGGFCARVWDVRDKPIEQLVLCDSREGLGNVFDTWSIAGFLPDNVHFVVEAGKIVWVWNLSKPQDAPMQLGPLLENIDSLSISALTGDIAVVSGGKVSRWSSAGEPIDVLTFDGDAVSSAYRGVGHDFATASSRGLLRIWRTADKIPFDVIHGNRISTMAMSRDGRWLATAGDRRIVVWPLEGNDLEPEADHVLEGHEGDGSIPYLALSGDGRWLVSGGEERAPRLWDLHRLDARRTTIPTNPNTRVGALVISNDRSTIVTQSDQAGSYVWLTSGEPSVRGLVDAFRVNRSILSADGTWMVGSAVRKPALLWNLRQPDQPPRELAGDPAARADTVSFDHRPTISGNGHWIAVADQTGTITVQPTLEGSARISRIRLAGGRATSLAFDSDGTVLYVTVQGELVRYAPIGSATTQPTATTLWHHESSIARLATQGDSVAAADEKGEINVWLEGEKIAEPPALKHAVRVLSWSDNGGRLVAGDEGGSLVVWTAATRETIRLVTDTGPALDAAFSADGKMLAAVFGFDESLNENLPPSVRVWNLDSPTEGYLTLAAEKPPGVWPGGKGAVTSGLAFGPNGKWLAAATQDGFISVWNLDPAYLTRSLCGSAGRGLKPHEIARYLDGVNPEACPELYRAVDLPLRGHSARPRLRGSPNRSRISD